MATQKKDALATTLDVALAIQDPAQRIDMAEVSAELGADAASLGMALFTRVKMPSGGGRAFEIEDADSPDAPEVSATIEGIVVAHHSVNAYWSKPMEDGGGSDAPDCSSRDGLTGHGDNGTGDGERPCAACPLNEFGSASDGGKACKNMKHLYVLRPADVLPLLVVLPPTSIKPWQVFMTKSILLKNRKVAGTLIRIGIEKAKSGGGIDYSRATFAYLGTVTDEQRAVLTKLGADLLPMVTEYVPAILVADGATTEPF